MCRVHQSGAGVPAGRPRRAKADAELPGGSRGRRAAGFGLAGALLLALGAAHYITVRSVTGLALWPASLSPPAPSIRLPAVVDGALPSFLHTLAFALLTAAAFGRRDALVPAVLAWGFVNLGFELGQHPGIARHLAGGYFSNGTFDLADVLAVACAVLLAASISFSLDRRSLP